MHYNAKHTSTAEPRGSHERSNLEHRSRAQESVCTPSNEREGEVRKTKMKVTKTWNLSK